MTVKLRLLWFALIAVMSTVNFVVLASGALNLEWVVPRIANGQFDSLPPEWRVACLLFAVLMVAQVVLAWQLLVRGGAWSPVSAVVSMLLVLLYVFSTVLSAISPSNDSRWNAIPAAVLMVSFFMLRAPAQIRATS